MRGTLHANDAERENFRLTGNNHDPRIWELPRISVRFIHAVMIQIFRHIAQSDGSRKLRGVQRIAARLARLVSLATVLIFFADTINADILFAAIVGDIRFADNPLILDSATDGTSVIPDNHTSHFHVVQPTSKADAGTFSRHLIPRFFGTTVTEDEDSPTVLDGATTATINVSVAPDHLAPKLVQSSPIPSFDRTITYGRLLI